MMAASNGKKSPLCQFWDEATKVTHCVTFRQIAVCTLIKTLTGTAGQARQLRCCLVAALAGIRGEVGFLR